MKNPCDSGNAHQFSDGDVITINSMASQRHTQQSQRAQNNISCARCFKLSANHQSMIDFSEYSIVTDSMKTNQTHFHRCLFCDLSFCDECYRLPANDCKAGGEHCFGDLDSESLGTDDTTDETFTQEEWTQGGASACELCKDWTMVCTKCNICNRAYCPNCQLMDKTRNPCLYEREHNYDQNTKRKVRDRSRTHNRSKEQIISKKDRERKESEKQKQKEREREEKERLKEQKKDRANRWKSPGVVRRQTIKDKGGISKGLEREATRERETMKLSDRTSLTLDNSVVICERCSLETKKASQCKNCRLYYCPTCSVLKALKNPCSANGMAHSFPPPPFSYAPEVEKRGGEGEEEGDCERCSVFGRGEKCKKCQNLYCRNCQKLGSLKNRCSDGMAHVFK